MVKFVKMFALIAVMLTVGLSITGGSALAAEQPNSPMTLDLGDVAGPPVITEDSLNSDGITDNGLFRKRYKGEVVHDPDSGEYIAVVHDRKTGTREAVGTRGNEEEAQTLADIEANRRNGVMDGPGCNPPLVLC